MADALAVAALLIWYTAVGLMSQALLTLDQSMARRASDNR